VTNDTNGLRDIFVNDSQTGQTIRVSVASDGTQASGGINEYPTISDDGRFVAWQSDATNLVTDDTNGDRDIYVHDTATGDTIRVSVSSAGDQADGWSYDPSY
jgi:Tol biopolymer transport system component